MWSKTKFASFLLLLWLVNCVPTVNSQQLPSQTDDPEDTTKDPQRWKTTGDDIVLLVRKVDEEHPYFKSMMFRKLANKSDILPKLTQMISHHCNITNITMLVKNDLLVLRTPEDASDLTSGDRIEVWTAIRGLATRSKTYMTFAKYVREGSMLTPVGPSKVAPIGGSIGGSGGSSPHHGGGGGGGGGGKNRKERKDRRAASSDDIFSSIEAEGF